jgi:transcriptional regulator with XRE-family HTH domain
MRTTIGATKAATMPPDLGGRLRHFRQRAGLSLEQVAIEIGLSARVMGDWERGYRSPRLVYLRRLATLYDVSIAAFVEVDTIPEEAAAGVA